MMTDGHLPPDPWLGPGVHLFDDAAWCLICGQHLLDAAPICRLPPDRAATVALSIRIGMISHADWQTAQNASQRRRSLPGPLTPETGGEPRSIPPRTAQEVSSS